jgi:hypothetical protein
MLINLTSDKERNHLPYSYFDCHKGVSLKAFYFSVKNILFPCHFSKTVKISTHGTRILHLALYEYDTLTYWENKLKRCVLGQGL